MAPGVLLADVLPVYKNEHVQKKKGKGKGKGGKLANLCFNVVMFMGVFLRKPLTSHLTFDGTCFPPLRKTFNYITTLFLLLL